MPVPLPLAEPMIPSGPDSTVAWSATGASNGTAMMPVMDAGVPPWMIHGGPALLAPPTRRQKSAGAALFVGLGVFVVAAGAVASVAWWSSQCDAGYQDSHGHCCRTDASWDESRRACVADATPAPTTPPALTPPPVLAPPPVAPPTPPQVTMEPIAPPPAPPSSAPTPPPLEPERPACLGAWAGRISENTGAYGSLRVSIRGTGDACGEWREVWENSGSTCVYRFVGCRFDGAAVRGTGVSGTPQCTPRVNAMMRCVGERMAFRESTSNGVVDTSTLRRVGQ
jgi:hypothetical protein